MINRLTFILIVCVSGVLFSCSEPSVELSKYTSKIDSLSTLVSEQQTEIIRLQAKEQSSSGLSSFHTKRYQNMGLTNPEESIIRSLMQLTEVIPQDGVLGGTMKFSSVKILNYKWAFAKYDDGHITGSALLEYKVTDDGKVEWRLIETESLN